jgi:hypothetical protein
VLGLSAGADVVLLGPAGVGALRRALEDVCRPRRLTEVPAGTAAGEALLALADAAEPRPGEPAAPLVVAAADLDLDLPALLDLLDRPGVGTAAAVVGRDGVDHGVDRASLARVGADGRALESVGTSAHTVTAPTHVVPGLLRVAAADRAEAARLWRSAAVSATPSWGGDLAALALLALVRGGVRVAASPLGPVRWSRGETGGAGAPGDPWRQRLRGASRGGDGFVSTFAVRPLSRRITAVGLRHDWAPNAVTVVSLAMGLVAAGLVATGWWWAWAVAAVLLLLALAVDCVDGEIARFTRRFSPLGAFLDAVGDRVKEYAVLAAVAAVAVREGSDAWPLATATLVAVTVRHLENDTYEHRIAFARASRPDLRPLTELRDGGPDGARTALAPPPTRRDTAVFWAKKVVHLPIAERYVLLAVTLLTRRPLLVLAVLLVATVVAVAWTQGGRTALALLGRDRTWRHVPRPAGRGHVDEQLDLGPLAVASGRVGRPAFWTGLAGAVLLAGAALALSLDAVGAALAAGLAGALLVGQGWQPPLHHPLDWQAPAALWVAESLVVAVLVTHTAGATSAAGFAFLCAVAYHRYDVLYRQRDTGEAPPPWLSVAGLGTDGRVVALLVVALLAPDALVPVLWVAAGYLTLLYVAESAAGWRRWIAAHTRGGAA